MWHLSDSKMKRSADNLMVLKGLSDTQRAEMGLCFLTEFHWTIAHATCVGQIPDLILVYCLLSLLSMYCNDYVTTNRYAHDSIPYHT